MFFGITNIWTYVIGTILIILLPGPNSLFVLSTAAQRGVRAGYRAACGVFLGDGVLMLLSAAGAASLLQSNHVLFSIVKYSGAAYLGWIGFGLIRSAVKSWRAPGAAEPAAPVTPAPVTPGGGFKAFKKALTISLLNPKAILFFVAFFVQFVDPAYSAPWLSFLILAVIVEVFSFFYLTALIFGGSFLANHFRRRRKVAAGLTSGVGALFLGFGAKLATTSLG